MIEVAVIMLAFALLMVSLDNVRKGKMISRLIEHSCNMPPESGKRGKTRVISPYGKGGKKKRLAEAEDAAGGDDA